MPFEDLQSGAGLDATLKSASPPYAMVMFTASWCGPCKAVKPVISQKVDSDWSKYPCKFGYIFEDTDIDVASFGVRAFPTFRVYKCGAGTDPTGHLAEVRGGDIAGIEAMLEEHCKDAFADSTGNSMGGEALTGDAARQARLARLGASMPGAPPPAPPDAEMTDAAAAAAPPAPSPVVKTLVDDMGFAQDMAERGVKNSNGTLEGAIDWITAHQDDPMEDDEPSGAIHMEDGKVTGDGVAKSYKCNVTGKIFASMASLELYANRTGHTDFSESTEEVKPLTPEEKAAKIKEIKALLAAKRAEREEAEKVDHVQREKQRRNMGKEMAKTREEMEKEERKRIIWAKKKEKEDAKKERERIRKELEADKLERKANKGKLKSQLGVDGYNPSAIQYDDSTGEVQKVSAIPKKVKTVDNRPKEQRVKENLARIASHRAGGDGLNCLNLIDVFFKNIVEKPGEEKFRRVNTAGKAYKSKVKGIVGGRKVLLECGFKDDGEERLVFGEEEDVAFLASVREMIKEEVAKLS